MSHPNFKLVHQNHNLWSQIHTSPPGLTTLMSFFFRFVSYMLISFSRYCYSLSDCWSPLMFFDSYFAIADSNLGLGSIFDNVWPHFKICEYGQWMRTPISDFELLFIVVIWIADVWQLMHPLWFMSLSIPYLLGINHILISSSMLYSSHNIFNMSVYMVLWALMGPSRENWFLLVPTGSYVCTCMHMYICKPVLEHDPAWN